MADTTQWNQDATAAATDIGTIMNGGADGAISALGSGAPVAAGPFPAAQHIERTVADRRQAVVEQGQRLDAAFADMRAHLLAVLADLGRTDTDNASTLT